MTPQLDVVGMVVADMPRSLAFYRRLGLDIPVEADQEAHVEVRLRGGLRLTFDTEDVIRSFDPEFQPPTGGNRVGIAFLCDSPAEVDRTYAELVADGYQGRLEPFDAEWGQRYAVIHDPDGNALDLFAWFTAPA
jgi:catechol 2,3-dioxygenase-like lactoylglutathione lyase family enzyme